jgi:hypothetical protein
MSTSPSSGTRNVLSVAVASPELPSSSVSNLVSRPGQFLLVLLPVLAAVFFGFIFYRASAVRE